MIWPRQTAQRIIFAIFVSSPPNQRCAALSWINARLGESQPALFRCEVAAQAKETGPK